MHYTKRDAAHGRHQESYAHSVAHTTMAILPRSLRNLPSLLLTTFTALKRTLLFSTVVVQHSQTTIAHPLDKPTVLPVTIQEAEVTILPLSSAATQTGTSIPNMPSIPVPCATYLSVQQLNNTITLAAVTGDHTMTHIQTPLQNEADLLSWLETTAPQHELKFVAAALRAEDPLKDSASKLWLQQDIVPYVIAKQDTNYHPDSEETARNIAASFDHNTIAHTRLSPTREVLVSYLVTNEDYQQTASAHEVALLSKLAHDFQGKKLVFINATPQGGGVALMRHALIRLLHLFNVDAHWYVLYPKKEAFDITKAKFHNVLQAVAPQGTELTPADQEVYDSWIGENALAFEEVFKQADVIVVDDPQPGGLIPAIKQVNASAKIIYRSHIQIVGHLASQEGTPQRTTWSFIWDKIKDADCFISHPMKMFIPDDVPAEKIFYMPATTDPLDGLNKPLTAEHMDYYMTLFNAMLLREHQTPLDERRPYIIQIARFDPSKGIPDVLDAYKKLRGMLEQHGYIIPQLVITGNGSIDDPDGVPIYNHVMELLRSEEYAPFADDIKVIKLPHIDQLLNTLLRRSYLVLQLSTKEGFEVKVTEALMKGKPVIAYRVGGIPLQIQDTINGHLVESGDTMQVARHLYHLLRDKDQYQQMCQAAIDLAGKDYLTIPNAICWLYMAMELLKAEHIEGNYQWVRALAENYGASDK